MSGMSVALLILQVLNSDGWEMGREFKRYPDMEACAEDRRAAISRASKDISGITFCVNLASTAELPLGVTVFVTAQLGSEPSEIEGRVVGPVYDSLTECREVLRIAGTQLDAHCVDFTRDPDSEVLMRRELKAGLRLLLMRNQQ